MRILGAPENSQRACILFATTGSHDLAAANANMPTTYLEALNGHADMLQMCLAAALLTFTCTS